MKTLSSVATVSLVVLLVAVVALNGVHVVEAVTCDPTELTPCMGAIMNSASPSSDCCGKLKEQKPCLCGYRSDPTLSQFVNSANAGKLLSTCGVSSPQC